MKQGMTLDALASELVRVQEAKKDFTGPARMVRFAHDDKAGLRAEGIAGDDAIPLTRIAHGQMANFTGIPKPYYDRLRDEAPDLLVSNVNEWLGRDERNRLMRTLDGGLRAWLSDRYRPLDNHDLAEATLPILGEKGCDMASVNLTEQHLYIKATLPGLRRDIKQSAVPGDVVEAGIMIRNSEVAMGALSIQPFVHRLICRNGMVVNDASMRRSHIGRRTGNGDENIDVYLTDDTRRLEDAALWSKVQDVVRGSFEPENFERIVNRMEESTQEPIRATGDLNGVVETACARLSLPMGQRDSILGHLAGGGDMTRYGLLNAVTRASQDVGDYELATSMEAAGGRLLALESKDWKAISEAVLKN